MERSEEKRAEIETLGGQDAMQGFPKNRFLANDPDYLTGWDDAQAFMKSVIASEGRNLRSHR
jgi:hypothetical protein